MGLIRNLIKEVTGTGSNTSQPSSQSRSRRSSESDYDNQAQVYSTSSSARRKSDSGDKGIVRATLAFATDKVTGAKPPQHRQDRVDGEHVATPEDVSKALELVTSACSDLQQAVDGLKKRGGLIGAAKAGVTMATSSSASDVPSTSAAGATTATAATASKPAAAKQTSLPAPGAKGSSTAEGEDALLTADAAAPATQSGWAKTGEVVKTIGHDGRIDADKLILDAHNKYEAAADLVDGMPEVDMAESHAPALGKLAAPLGGAAQITMLAVGAGAGAFGIISRVIKRKRTKKATGSVEGMLAEYEAVRLQLESLNRAGRGGMLQPYAGPAPYIPQQQQQYGSRPPVHPPQPNHGGSAAGAPAVGVPVGSAPVPQYGYAPPAQQYPQYGASPQYGAPPPQQYQQQYPPQQQYGAPPPQQYQQQQYGAPPPQQYQQQQPYGTPQSRQQVPDLL